eukprot:gene17677-biopygen5362
MEGPRAGRGERAMYRIAPWFRAQAGAEDDSTGGGVKFNVILLIDRQALFKWLLMLWITIKSSRARQQYCGEDKAI